MNPSVPVFSTLRYAMGNNTRIANEMAMKYLSSGIFCFRNLIQYIIEIGININNPSYLIMEASAKTTKDK